MNTAEKIAALYLRLNGFLLMPQFTTFGAGSKPRKAEQETGKFWMSHDHTDILGFRPAGSHENNAHIASKKKKLEAVVFPLDEELFSAMQKLAKFSNFDFPEQDLSVVCEVRANEKGKFPTEERCKYCSMLVGNAHVIPMLMDTKATHAISIEDNGIRIGVARALRWIYGRVDWLDKHCDGVKTASWTWSDEFLSDLILLREFGLQVPGRVPPMLVQKPTSGGRPPIP